jgi:hypothetical protein
MSIVNVRVETPPPEPLPEIEGDEKLVKGQLVILGADD